MSIMANNSSDRELSTMANNSSDRELSIMANNSSDLDDCVMANNIGGNVYMISNILDTPVQIETACLICGEGVGTWLGDYTPKICGKCRDAVMAMRKKMEDTV